jgi:hypothetical protein
MIEECPRFEFRCLGTDLGDYLLQNGEHELAIERKNISDFCATYIHLKKRLANMHLHYQRVGLLLEGTYMVANNEVYILEGNTMKPRMSYETFCNFFAHQCELHTWVIPTMSFDESFFRIIHLHNYLPKLSAPVPSFKCASPTEWLVQLPGVGSGTVQKLKDRYGSPLDAINEGLPKKAKEVLTKW